MTLTDPSGTGVLISDLGDAGRVNYDTGRILINPIVNFASGEFVEVDYTTLQYDRGWNESYARVFGAPPGAEPISCDVFVENLVALASVPDISQCDPEIRDALSRAFGTTSASSAACRLLDESDPWAAFAGVACAVFPPLALFFDKCNAQHQAGYRGELSVFLRGYLADALRCMDHLVRERLSTATIAALPTAVWDAYRAGEEAIYSELGGQARQEMIAVHTELDAVNDGIQAFDRELSAAELRAEFAVNFTEYTASDLTEQSLCISGNIMQSIGGVWSAMQGFGGGGGGGDALSSLGGAFENSSRTRRECIAGDVSAYSQGIRALVDVDNSARGMDNTLRIVRTGLATLAAADGRLENIERDRELAGSRRRITERIAATSVAVPQDPSWRVLQGADSRRARARLFRAQQQAFIARRAIEFRLASDMRTMTLDEPFVDAPSTWSNDVFTLDTATLPGTMGSGNLLVAGEALGDYVANLRAFVNGYPFARRFSEATDVTTLNLSSLGVNVPGVACRQRCGFASEALLYRCADSPDVWLPGGFELVDDVPNDEVTVAVCPDSPPPPCGLSPPQTVDEECSRPGSPCNFDEHVLEIANCAVDAAETRIVDSLLFQCSGHDGLLLGGVPPGTEPGIEPCGDHDQNGVDELGEVVSAQYTFTIPSPPLAYFSERLAINNYNYRVRGITLNLVGTSVLDCSRAPRRAECYGDGNVQYTLQQSGYVALESFEGERRSYLMEPGRIEHARALAAERYLTNPLSSADRSLLLEYERSEWLGRPLSGVYTLTIYGRPEIRWENLDDVQVLLRYDYWTRQN